MLETRPRDKQRRSAPMDFSNATILCLGDLMLDRFAYCDSQRISPEAPVPVLLLERGASAAVTSFFTLRWPIGNSLPQALHRPNTAAGSEVSKLGIATVKLDEL